MTRWLEVEAPGFLTTVQDLGRFGAQALGVPVSGALDPLSLRLANALVGNPDGTAGLEIRMIGPKLKVHGGPARVALVGTEASLLVTGAEAFPVPSAQSVTVAPGDTLQVGSIADTGVCYLSIAGGFHADTHFSSQATYIPAKLGGIAGRALEEGDLLKLTEQDSTASGEMRLTKDPTGAAPGKIRVVLGPQADRFTPSAIDEFLRGEYVVQPTSSRMGLRLAGPKLSFRSGHNIPSDGIVTGSIQVPGDGQPIILLADRQTTGGYPKVATVVSADLPRLGRLRPGDEIRFTAIDVADAIKLRRSLERRVQDCITSIEPVPTSRQDLLRLLLRENLISGAISGFET